MVGIWGLKAVGDGEARLQSRQLAECKEGQRLTPVDLKEATDPNVIPTRV